MGEWGDNVLSESVMAIFVLWEHLREKSVYWKASLSCHLRLHSS